MQTKLTKITDYSQFLTILLLVSISCIPLFIAYNYPSFLNDDSYITLTFSKNIAMGKGFIFNHPPSILGTTSPLFSLIVAWLSIILPKIEIPIIAVFLTAFCWLGINWLFFFFKEEWELNNWQVCILSSIIVCTGWMGFLGMEAYFFAYLLVLTISLFLKKQFFLTGFFSGLLFLTRGEGILLLVVIISMLLFQAWTKRKAIDKFLLNKLFKIGLGISIPILIWSVYAYFTFGSFLTNTLGAKQAQVQSGSFRPFFQRLMSEWMPLWGSSFKLLSFPILNVWWVILFLGFIFVLLHKRNWLILVGWIFFYTLGYSILNVAGYWWYVLPILFVLNIFFGLGIIWILELINKYIKIKKLAFAFSFIMTLFLLFILSKPNYIYWKTYQGDPRGKSYTNLSQWFRENTNSQESIAFIEIGYLGYYTDNRIIDLAGLVLPEIVPHIANGDFSWGFWNYAPDYYIYLPDFDWALASIKENPRFDQEYQEVATLVGPRETNFTIFKRKIP